MTDAPLDVGRIVRGGRVAGVVGLLVCAVGWLLAPRELFRAYLVAWVSWSGLAAGCLGICLLQFLTGGTWGLVIRRVLEAGARTLPLVAVLALPLALGLPSLYAWARPEVVAADAALARQAVYLNAPFFLARAVLYLACWVGLAILLGRWSDEQDRTGDPRLAARLWRLSAGGLILLSLTASFAAIDWTMSLEPEWSSTVYPAMVPMGHVLGAFALTIVVTVLLAGRGRLAGLATPALLNDLGSLLLAFVMLWTYLAFSQLILIWAGNLVEEIPWYLRRTRGGWELVSAAIVLLGFAVPFGMLVFRDVKRAPRWLAAVAGLLLVMRLVEVFWLVTPALSPAALHVHWLDLAAVVGIGGLWLAELARQLSARPLLPRHDPRLAPALAHTTAPESAPAGSGA